MIQRDRHQVGKVKTIEHANNGLKRDNKKSLRIYIEMQSYGICFYGYMVFEVINVKVKNVHNRIKRKSKSGKRRKKGNKIYSKGKPTKRRIKHKHKNM